VGDLCGKYTGEGGDFDARFQTRATDEHGHQDITPIRATHCACGANLLRLDTQRDGQCYACRDAAKDSPTLPPAA
jgi:hypothetical protein